MHRLEPLPEYVNTDGLRVRQCLVNLLSNAIKFTERGYVYLNVSAKLYEGKDYISFEVEDSGVGIEKDKLNSIFDAFCRVDGSSTRKYGGTGLGLTITRKLVGLLGGAITVESEVGRGSAFTVWIPVEVNPVLETERRETSLSIER
ncbi:MAG: hypothetical protein ISS71_02470 [Phycisphaerae bacterium]|nr:hypothetical protein [Phycisphaerae bacterium]